MSRSGDGGYQLVTGAERRVRLLALGCAPALVDAFDHPSPCWLASGEELADLLDIPYVHDHWMPSGTIVPVCRLGDGNVHFALFLIDRSGAATLVECHDEFLHTFEGGMLEFLTERLQTAWELERAPDEELVRWATHIGYPAPLELFERLARR